MNKEKLKAYGVDYENAVKRFAGNEALYERFLKKLAQRISHTAGEPYEMLVFPYLYPGAPAV